VRGNKIRKFFTRSLDAEDSASFRDFEALGHQQTVPVTGLSHPKTHNCLFSRQLFKYHDRCHPFGDE